MTDGFGAGEKWTLSDTESSLAARFDHLLAYRPNALAVAGGASQFTYAALDRLAAGYSAACCERGWPGLGSRAALLMGHGGRQLAAALAILRGGGAVVTLNPNDPPARLSEIREAVAPAVVVTEPRFLERARAAGFDDEAVVIEPGRGPEHQVDVRPDALSFLICTSGSTGRPKIVMQSHRNMLHNILRYTNGLGVGHSERIAWLASLSGMQGIVTAWCGLMNGATVCPFPLADRGLVGLDDWIESERITLFDALPSILRSFDRVLPAGRVINGVRLVRLGSEPAFRSDLDTFRRRFANGTVLASVFGSSEAGTMAQMLIGPGCEISGERLPVGTVTEGIAVALRNEAGEPVSDGEIGEIVVYGDHLSPGYWRDARLTAQRFGEDGGGRYYRTGDLARRDESDNLTVIGRVDSLVKVNGFGVQLEEVEAALIREPNVAAAAVTLTLDQRGHTRLVAYVSSRNQVQLSARELRRALREKLAPQAVPHEFSFVSELPLNSNGKIDRSRLAERAGGRAKRRRDDSLRPDIIDVLSRLWATALERDAIRVDETFLELGGDSLSAAVIAADVHDQFGVELGLDEFGEALTVQKMANLIGPARKPLAGVGRDGELQPRREPLPESPLTFAQESMWHQAAKKGAGFNGAAGFRICGVLDPGALRRSVEQIVRRHEILRTGFVVRDGQPVAVVHPPAPVELPVVDLSRDAEPEKRALELLAIDARTPFDLRGPSLVRLRLVRVHSDEHWLLRTIHHLVSDALSWDIFVSELAALYSAFRSGGASPLSDELPLQMGDYARWERRTIDPASSAFRAELEWWRQRLEPRPAAIALPFLRAEAVSGVTDADGIVELVVGRDLAAPLDSCGRDFGATYFMTRLAMFSALVGIETGIREMAIDTYLSLRRRGELRGMFGPLINRSVIRLGFDQAMSLADWLVGVRAEVVDLHLHGWIPFDLMLDELRERGVARPVLGTKFQVDEEPSPARFAGLEVEPLRRDPVEPWAFMLLVKRSESGERWRAVFDPKLHDPAGVERFLVRMRALAAAACAEPRRPLGELSRAGPPAPLLNAVGRS
jgi:acyl-CoA synthetase (AMP-forming)/AMP-acid ligase II/acyl carrier protein